MNSGSFIPAIISAEYNPQYSYSNLNFQDVLLDMVRKKLAVHLKILAAHGLKSTKKDSLSLVSCASKNRHYVKGTHPWMLLTEFYTLQVCGYQLLCQIINDFPYSH